MTPESERQPAHVARVSTLPEIDGVHLSFFRFFLRRLLVTAALLRRNPVSAQKHVAIRAVKIPCNQKNFSH